MRSSIKPSELKLSKALKRLSMKELGLIARTDPKKVQRLAKTILSLKVRLEILQESYRKI